MTLPIERSRSRRPVTWLTLIGVLLLPVVIGGILVAALYNPVERLDSLTAAVPVFMLGMHLTGNA